MEMLQNFFTPQLSRFSVNENMLFQQDWATSHTARMLTNAVNALFPNRVVSRNGDIPWPSRSPDLTPLRLFSLGIPENKSVWNKAKNYRGFKTANSRWSGCNPCGDAATGHEQFQVTNLRNACVETEAILRALLSKHKFSNWHKTKWLFISFSFMTNKQMQNSCVDFFLCFEILPFHCPNLVEATCNVRAYTYTNHGTGYKYIRGSIKMSAESLYFCEIQTSAII